MIYNYLPNTCEVFCAQSPALRVGKITHCISLGLSGHSFLWEKTPPLRKDTYLYPELRYSGGHCRITIHGVDQMLIGARQGVYWMPGLTTYSQARLSPPPPSTYRVA